ncbi:superinfection immunity protein [Caballeronia insecticola]|uniref:superinfection immunity protein n=1 Tax=Caballeronia insecticola TaxID=758793 RepID=UPI001E64D8A0|nr:superinfection immunity protein [Caballeronia insecticola]
MIALYLAPSIIADVQGRKDAFLLTVVNILLGWTVIGWFGVFFWARHPVTDKRLRNFAKRAARATAKATIDALVLRVGSGAGTIGRLGHRLVPIATRVAVRTNQSGRGSALSQINEIAGTFAPVARGSKPIMSGTVHRGN